MPTIKIDSDNVKEYTLKSDTLDICQTCNKEITIHPINIGNFVICTVPICSFKCPRCFVDIHSLFNIGFACLIQHFDKHISEQCNCVKHKRCESCLTYIEKGSDHQCSSHVNSQGQIEHKVIQKERHETHTLQEHQCDKCDFPECKCVLCQLYKGQASPL